MSRFSRAFPARFSTGSAAGLLIAVFLLATLPNLSVRSFVWEEGRCAELARDIAVHGNFLEPSIYGIRYIEKPSLLSWMIAAVARATGEVDEWSARLPAMAAVLVTALSVFMLTRKVASESASLFAAACFLLCPLLLRKLTIAEPDTVVTALEFGALIIWWRGADIGMSTWRCLVIGALLATAAMAKGPQPIAYFALGAGGYLFAHKRWPELVRLILILTMPAAAIIAWAYAVYRPGDLPAWLVYMHLTPPIGIVRYLFERIRFSETLLLDLLPAILLLPFFWRQWRSHRTESNCELGELLMWYAGAATLALLFWPGVNTRYAMPAAPAVAVMGGLVFDDLWQQRHSVVRLASTILVVLLIYQLVLVWVIVPVFATRFGASRAAGRAIAEAVGRAPAPVFNVNGPNSNQLFYARLPVRTLPLADALTLEPPAWLVVPPNELEWIRRNARGYSFGEPVKTTSGPNLVAVRIDQKPGAVE